MNRSLGVTLLVVLGLLVAPAAAAAESFYATPSPAAGASCSAASPCGLATALSTAASGDTVVIGAGSYEPEAEYEDGGKSLTIEGAVIGVGRPVVHGSFTLTGPATRISDVQMAGLFLGGGAEADRVVSINNGFADGCEIETTGGSISNSLCATDSTFFSGLSTQSRAGSGPMTVHNVTMIGHNGFYAGPSGAISIRDSIAMRNAPAGEDASLGIGTTSLLRSYALHSSGSAVENEDPLIEEPIFRGPGDYREAADSPSIDFGAATAEPGELDLDGNLREIGAKTDIGAYEFVPDPPSVSTPSVTVTSPTSATLDATINPDSGRTYYHVEYGPSAAYGSSTPTATLSAATTPATVQVGLAGLPAGSTLHYRVVATSDGGTTTTAGATFETPPGPPTPPSPVPTTTPTTTSTSTSAPTPAPVTAPTQKLAPKLRFTQGKGGASKGQPLLDRSTIKLSTACGPVACNVSVEGKVKIGAKTFGTLSGPSAPTHWQAGKQGAIKLRVGAKLQKRVRAYLVAHPGARAKIFVTATFVTADQAQATRKLTIPVRPI